MSTDFPCDSPDLPDWISQAEAARIQGVSRQAIHKLVQGGSLTTLRVGGRLLVNRAEVEARSPRRAGRPAAGEDRTAEGIWRRLEQAPRETRREIARRLRREFPIHDLESRLGIEAEVILEAISRGGALTLRMIRGVIAECAFGIYVVERLRGWESLAIEGDPPYDFLLRDDEGTVRVQVKLQRSERGRPKLTGGAGRFVPGMSMVETQRTRGGVGRRTGQKTRPYRFGEFDVLAVAMQPSMNRWDAFLYTVAPWLIPSLSDPAALATYQPVASGPDDDWTDDFSECIRRLRSGEQKTIRGVK